jgi:copper homeostasis protein
MRFDLTPNIEESLKTLIDLGVERVLSSGGAPSALAGAAVLAALVERARAQIQILGAGGIRPHNVAEIIGRTGLTAVHLRAAKVKPSASLRCDLPNDYDPGSRPVTSEQLIADMILAMHPDGTPR